jgi:serine/threonine protein kinase
MSVNDYKLEKLIGAGTFGEIYQGSDVHTGQKVAIKRIKKKLLYENGSFLLNAYKKEVEIMKLCECENSIKFICDFDSDNNLNIIMELCDKDLLVYLYERKTAFTIDEIRETFLQLNNAFRKMRYNNILHRDLKLGNVLIKFTDESKMHFIPKLADYGFSKELSIYNTRTTHLGTPATMAPEIMMNLPYDEKSDLWSVGVMMYQLYYKEIPYDGMTEMEILNKIRANTPYKQPEDKYFRDLLNKIFVVNPQNRISWNEYFNHQFFTGKEMTNQNQPEKSMFNSYYFMNNNQNFLELKPKQSFSYGKKESNFFVQGDIYEKSKSEELINPRKYEINLLEKGRNINDFEYNGIINSCLDVIKNSQSPYSFNCINEIKKKLRGEWFVFVTDETEDNYDFYISNSNDGRFVIFECDDRLFQVCQIS